MFASRVTVSERTMVKHRASQRAMEMRRELVKSYIQSKPYGKRIKMVEFARAMGTTEGRADQIIKNMVTRGVIVRHELSPRRFFYTVPGDVKVTKPGTVVEPEHEPSPEEVAKVAAEVNYSPQQIYAGTLEEAAMRFAWQHPLYNNDLREFLKWFKSEGGV